MPKICRSKNVGVRFTPDEHAALKKFATKVSWCSQPVPIGNVVRTLALDRLEQLQKKAPRRI
jgi:hypothetical protein